MSTPAELVDEIISQALSTASEFTTQVDDAADALIASKAGIYVTPPTNSSGFEPEAIEPEIPEASDTLITYQAELEEIVSMLTRELADFFDTYYPLANDSFDEATSWLVNAITNGGTGINADIEAQTWQRMRDRIIADGKRVQAQIETGFAAKGYSVPPGAMLAAVRESLYDQTSKTGEGATAMASKQLEIEIATVKFAIEESLKSREMAMAAAADYIKALAGTPADAVKVATMTEDTKANMMSAAASWYKARQGRDELVLQSKLAEMNTGFDIYKQRKDSANTSSQIDVGALAAAADAYGKTASAALASLNSIVSTSVNSFQ